jgi:hypothetical protein
MSTLEATPGLHRLRTRFRAGLLALGVLIAIGAAVVTLPLTGSNHATNPHATIGGAQIRRYTAAALPSAGPGGRFRDPTTHALVHVPDAGRNAWPTLASVLSP